MNVIQFARIELFLEAVVFALILYAILRRRWNWLERLVPVFFILLIPVMIGLNEPNPDHIKLVQVAVVP